MIACMVPAVQQYPVDGISLADYHCIVGVTCLNITVWSHCASHAALVPSGSRLPLPEMYTSLEISIPDTPEQRNQRSEASHKDSGKLDTIQEEEVEQKEPPSQSSEEQGHGELAVACALLLMLGQMEMNLREDPAAIFGRDTFCVGMSPLFAYSRQPYCKANRSMLSILCCKDS